MYINSPGGQVTAGLAIYDTMQVLPAANLVHNGRRSVIANQSVRSELMALAVPAEPDQHHLHGASRVDGEPAARGRRTRSAAVAA